MHTFPQHQNRTQAKSISRLVWSLFLILCTIPFQLEAQQSSLIAVQRNGNFIFHEDVATMIPALQSGDSIFFPGGNFVLPNQVWPINFPLTILGSGYRTDSATTTGRTLLIGRIDLNGGSNGTFISGVSVSENIIFSTANSGPPNNCHISRCFVSAGIAVRGTGHLISESVIEGANYFGACCNVSIYAYFSTGNTYRNNIFEGRVVNTGIGSVIEYNVFLTPQAPLSNASGGGSPSAENCTIYRNIFLTNSNAPSSNTYDCIFQENVFLNDWTGNFGSNTDLNNIYNQTQSSIFADQFGNQFELGDDYHIQPSSAAYNGGGQNQIGLYGGPFGFKENTHPIQPRIIEALISNSTDANGNLHVKFKVEAQSN